MDIEVSVFESLKIKRANLIQLNHSTLLERLQKPIPVSLHYTEVSLLRWMNEWMNEVFILLSKYILLSMRTVMECIVIITRYKLILAMVKLIAI